MLLVKDTISSTIQDPFVQETGVPWIPEQFSPFEIYTSYCNLPFFTEYLLFYRIQYNWSLPSYHGEFYPVSRLMLFYTLGFRLFFFFFLFLIGLISMLFKFPKFRVYSNRTSSVTYPFVVPTWDHSFLLSLSSTTFPPGSGLVRFKISDSNPTHLK